MFVSRPPTAIPVNPFRAMSVFAWPTAAARTAVPTDAVEPAANAKVSMSFVMADSASAPGLPVAKPAVLRIRFAPMSWNVATRPVRVMSVVKMVVADCVVFVRVGIGPYGGVTRVACFPTQLERTLRPSS